MSIFRTTDPTQFAAVDGIIVAETAPPPSVVGVGTNIAIIAGLFERGPVGMVEVGSLGDIYTKYGNNNSFSGMAALRNKKFARLKIIRVTASAAAIATLVCSSAVPTATLTFNALSSGLYGNNITITVASGTVSGKKYTVTDTNPNAFNPAEIYDNIDVTTYATVAAANAANIFGASLLISATWTSVVGNPASASATSLASGTAGSVADTDYQTALAYAAVEAAGNILFLDAYNATRNGYLVTHAAATEDKMVVVCGASGDSESTASTDAASYRDVDGRIIYGYPYVKTSIDGVLVTQPPASWIASIISQTGPNIDPAYSANAQFTGGITSLLNTTLTRTNYINLKNAGICAFENDSDIGIKLRSGVCTQISDSSKVMIFRRRMADYLTYSAAKFLKNFQNAPNTKKNRTAINASISGFVQLNEQIGLLPSDAELKSGKAKLIDTESLNTDANVAAGYVFIIWKQRIYSSARFMVIQAQIGESVVVTAA